MAALETAARLLGVRAGTILRMQQHLPCLASSWPVSPVKQVARPMPACWYHLPPGVRCAAGGSGPLLSTLPCIAFASLSSGVGRGAGGRADDARY